jgi:toxin-antitoxin system PIN domain toxin
MIAVDTNLLLYAHRAESPWHEAAVASLGRAASERWGIPWPCVHEFLAIATHPKVFDPPSPLKDALAAVQAWLESPTLSLLAEYDGYLDMLGPLLRSAQVAGPRIHDARIAAICLQHGVAELWTADRDFSRFPSLVTRNPLVAKR